MSGEVSSRLESWQNAYAPAQMSSKGWNKKVVLLIKIKVAPFGNLILYIYRVDCNPW